VCLRQPLVRLIADQFYDFHFLNSVGASQAFEAFYGDFAAASDKLDELCFIGAAEFLEHFPEPLDDFRLFAVAFVDDMLPQVLDINNGQTTDEKL
jgi:hypothetical protein